MLNDNDLNQIENPAEMEMLEAHEDDIQDDDPETLEEMEHRQDELVELFMEISLNKKHEVCEKTQADFMAGKE